MSTPPLEPMTQLEMIVLFDKMDVMVPNLKNWNPESK
jgi:hypothetical protein